MDYFNDYTLLGQNIIDVGIILGEGFPIDVYKPVLDFYFAQYSIPCGYVTWLNGIAVLNNYKKTGKKIRAF